MIADADESIVGLMAKHMMEGKDFPVFFYGQSYGLALLEAGTAAIFFALFGVSTVSLKAAMLLLWGSGWLIFVMAVARLGGRRAAWIAGLLLILCPAWGAWSMKARGGYLTAFILSSLALWLLGGVMRSRRPRIGANLAFGCCLGAIFLAQATWLFGLAPFVVLLLQKRRNGAEGAAIFGGAAVTAGLILLTTAGTRSTYWAPELFDNSDVIQALLLLPRRVWVHLGGAYYMKVPAAIGPFTVLSASLWSAALAGGLAHSILSLRRRGPLSISQACTFSIPAVLLFSVLISYTWFGHRHLLAISGFLIVFLSIELARLVDNGGRKRIAALTAVAALGISGALSLVEFRGLSFLGPPPDQLSEEAALETLIEDLLGDGITHLYSMDPLLQWVVMFESEERITARWFKKVDRYPAYPAAVDRALFSGERVALIGRISYHEIFQAIASADGDYSNLRPRLVAGRYAVLPDPDAALLDRLGFELTGYTRKIEEFSENPGERERQE